MHVTLRFFLSTSLIWGLAFNDFWNNRQMKMSQNFTHFFLHFKTDCIINKKTEILENCLFIYKHKNYFHGSNVRKTKYFMSKGHNSCIIRSIMIKLKLDLYHIKIYLHTEIEFNICNNMEEKTGKLKIS